MGADYADFCMGTAHIVINGDFFFFKKNLYLDFLEIVATHLD